MGYIVRPRVVKSSSNANNGTNAGRFYLMDAVSAFSTVMSYYGWQKYGNAWNLFTKHLSPELRQRMSWKTTDVNNPLKGLMT